MNWPTNKIFSPATTRQTSFQDYERNVFIIVFLKLCSGKQIEQRKELTTFKCRKLIKQDQVLKPIYGKEHPINVPPWPLRHVLLLRAACWVLPFEWDLAVTRYRYALFIPKVIPWHNLSHITKGPCQSTPLPSLLSCCSGLTYGLARRLRFWRF